MLAPTVLQAQLSTEQNAQISQYKSLISDYKKKNELRMAGYYQYKIGTVYLEANQYTKAIDEFLIAAEYYEKIGSYSNKKKIYSNVAFLYAELGQLKNAKKYYNKSLEISRVLKNRNDISASLMEVATMEIYAKDYTNAQSHLGEALQIANSLNDARLLRTCYRLLSQLYQAYGNKKKSKEYYENFLIYDKHVKEEDARKREEKANQTITEEKKKSQILIEEKELQSLKFKALELEKRFREDSLARTIKAKEDSIARVEEEKVKFAKLNELLEKESELQENRIKRQELEAQQAKMKLYGAIAGIALLALLIIVALVAFIQKRKANKLLEQQKIEIEIKSEQIKHKNDELEDAMEKIQYQNKNIMQSINYAQRIQEAMMPKQETMQALFKDSFIFFKPRDIVSGDFYWFKEVVPKEKGVEYESEQLVSGANLDHEKYVVAAVDCTGHGVPGAFMSMLGYNLLNDIVGKGIIEPNDILSNLHKGIRTSLNQDATQNRDGMDMALCVIDPKEKIVEYAGAQNPLIYIQDGKLYRVRGNKYPVGGFQVENHEYTKHVIKVDKPTTFYIFSDGFHDQFGGPSGRKFMTKNFRDLLYEIYNMPMEEQKNILELVINEWKGDNEQTDDILVIGFRLDFSEERKMKKPLKKVISNTLETENRNSAL
ncbi:MAG: SpoIIE family protein phosphatase [Bacteroidales bacterium]|nr:SpoIIE family protein phosphatase [Bacteroidales bacterium]